MLKKWVIWATLVFSQLLGAAPPSQVDARYFQIVTLDAIRIHLKQGVDEFNQLSEENALPAADPVYKKGIEIYEHLESMRLILLAMIQGTAAEQEQAFYIKGLFKAAKDDAVVVKEEELGRLFLEYPSDFLKNEQREKIQQAEMAVLVHLFKPTFLLACELTIDRIFRPLLPARFTNELLLRVVLNAAIQPSLDHYEARSTLEIQDEYREFTVQVYAHVARVTSSINNSHRQESFKWTKEDFTRKNFNMLKPEFRNWAGNDEAFLRGILTPEGFNNFVREIDKNNTHTTLRYIEAFRNGTPLSDILNTPVVGSITPFQPHEMNKNAFMKGVGFCDPREVRQEMTRLGLRRQLEVKKAHDKIRSIAARSTEEAEKLDQHRKTMAQIWHLLNVKKLQLKDINERTLLEAQLEGLEEDEDKLLKNIGKKKARKKKKRNQGSCSSSVPAEDEDKEPELVNETPETVSCPPLSTIDRKFLYINQYPTRIPLTPLSRVMRWHKRTALEEMGTFTDWIDGAPVHQYAELDPAAKKSLLSQHLPFHLAHLLKGESEFVSFGKKYYLQSRQRNAQGLERNVYQFAAVMKRDDQPNTRTVGIISLGVGNDGKDLFHAMFEPSQALTIDSVKKSANSIVLGNEPAGTLEDSASEGWQIVGGVAMEHDKENDEITLRYATQGVTFVVYPLEKTSL